MNRGYVRLWRKSLEAGWIKNHKLWAFWTWCLLKASHKKFDAIVGLQRVNLLPGQFVFGLKKASEETGLTIREIRTILNFLKKSGNLTIKTTNKFSVITIINWNSYQAEESEYNTQNDKQKENKGKHTKTIKHKSFLSDSDEVRLAEFLLGKIISRNPKFKKPKNIQSWAKQIDYMIRLDNRTPEEIREIIEWCQKDPFWRGNILSTAKLREKFDQLVEKMPETRKAAGSW